MTAVQTFVYLDTDIWLFLYLEGKNTMADGDCPLRSMGDDHCLKACVCPVAMCLSGLLRGWTSARAAFDARTLRKTTVTGVRLFYGCSTVVLIGISCPAITVVTPTKYRFFHRARENSRIKEQVVL